MNPKNHKIHETKRQQLIKMFNDTNGMNKSVYFILFLHVNIDDLLMRHACGFKKKEKACIAS